MLDRFEASIDGSFASLFILLHGALECFTGVLGFILGWQEANGHAQGLRVFRIDKAIAKQVYHASASLCHSFGAGRDPPTRCNRKQKRRNQRKDNEKEGEEGEEKGEGAKQVM